MTWTDIVDVLQRRWGLTIERANWCGLIVDLADQKQKIAVKAGEDGESIRLAARVCPLRHIDPLEALLYNRAVEPWSLGLENDVYVLARAVPMAVLDERALADFVRGLAEEAMRLRDQCVPAPIPASVLSSNFAFWFDS